MKSGRTGIYLVTTEDTLGLYHYFPKTEKDEPEKQKRSGRVIPGEFPDRDSLYGIPESTDNDLPIINPNDMTGFEKWEPKTRLEYQYEHIRAGSPTACRGFLRYRHHSYNSY